jgi:hypothetical protein
VRKLHLSAPSSRSIHYSLRLRDQSAVVVKGPFTRGRFCLFLCGKYYGYLSEWIQLFPPMSHCLFLPPNIDATLLRPLIFLGSASILYIPLYRPLIFSNILDLILFGSNKGYPSCSPCHHFHICHVTIWGRKVTIRKPPWRAEAWSPPAAEEFGAMGREIESRQGMGGKPSETIN